jgi:hypothetical protein
VNRGCAEAYGMRKQGPRWIALRECAVLWKTVLDSQPASPPASEECRRVANSARLTSDGVAPQGTLGVGRVADIAVTQDGGKTCELTEGNFRQNSGGESLCLNHTGARRRSFAGRCGDDTFTSYGQQPVRIVRHLVPASSAERLLKGLPCPMILARRVRTYRPVMNGSAPKAN